MKFILYLIGVFIGKALGISGIGGAISGYFSKNLNMSIILGIVFGVLDSLLVTTSRVIPSPFIFEAIQWSVSVCVGVLASILVYSIKNKRR